MTWPATRKQVHPYQAMIVYPVRGIATVWETGAASSPAALGALIEASPAQIRTLLAEPKSTTSLARRLAITPGAISQHLTVLRSNGLVTRTRIGGVVLYQRTTRGDTLASLTG